MSDHEVKMIIPIDRRPGRVDPVLQRDPRHDAEFPRQTHFAALDGGPVTLALATAIDHPIPGRWSGHQDRRMSTPRRGHRASEAGSKSSATTRTNAARSSMTTAGNGLVFTSPLAR